MKRFILFCFTIFIVFSLAPVSADHLGCFTLQPFLDKNHKEIHDEKTCKAQKTRHFKHGGPSLHTCWVGSPHNTCYWTNDAAQCTCIQNGGTVCIYAMGNKGQAAYCKWGSGDGTSACDTWLLAYKVAKPKGYKVNINQPVSAENRCRFLGGTPEGGQCKNFKTNQNTTETCSLSDLWMGKCP